VKKDQRKQRRRTPQNRGVDPAQEIEDDRLKEPREVARTSEKRKKIGVIEGRKRGIA